MVKGRVWRDSFVFVYDGEQSVFEVESYRHMCTCRLGDEVARYSHLNMMLRYRTLVPYSNHSFAAKKGIIGNAYEQGISPRSRLPSHPTLLFENEIEIRPHSARIPATKPTIPRRYVSQITGPEIRLNVFA